MSMSCQFLFQPAAVPASQHCQITWCVAAAGGGHWPQVAQHGSPVLQYVEALNVHAAA